MYTQLKRKKRLKITTNDKYAFCDQYLCGHMEFSGKNPSFGHNESTGGKKRALSPTEMVTNLLNIQMIFDDLTPPGGTISGAEMLLLALCWQPVSTGVVRLSKQLPGCTALTSPHNEADPSC